MILEEKKKNTPEFDKEAEKCNKWKFHQKKEGPLTEEEAKKR